jgi:hypothetical protein
MLQNFKASNLSASVNVPPQFPAKTPLSVSAGPRATSPIVAARTLQRSIDNEVFASARPALSALFADLEALSKAQSSPKLAPGLRRSVSPPVRAKVVAAPAVERVSASVSVPPAGSSSHRCRPLKAVQAPNIFSGGLVSAAINPVAHQAIEVEAWLKPVINPVAHQAIDVEPWLKAAQQFRLNTDFETKGMMEQGSADLKLLMDAMKVESDGKQTIQALADKIMSSQILENLEIPCLPNLLAVWDSVTREEVAEVIDREMVDNPDCEDIVIKPTHLSSGQGVCSITALQPGERDEVVDWLTQHMQEFMAVQAAAHESLALQSLRPGFIAQPRYKANVHFKLPLELRVVALWGRVRMGIWWWGRAAANCDHPHRNVWIVRQPTTNEELSDHDDWKVIHGHTGSNPGFEKAIEIFKQHMPVMVSHCEKLATAVGAPFLRADFFVGNSKWGVRLNEIAYGCGCDYRNRGADENGRIFDDGPAMARILQEGMALCQERLPPSEFLPKLGVDGDTYAEMTVQPLKSPLPPLQHDDGHALEDSIISDVRCETPPPTARTPQQSHTPVSAQPLPLLSLTRALPALSHQAPVLPIEARSRSLEPPTRLLAKPASPRQSVSSRRSNSNGPSRTGAVTITPMAHSQARLRNASPDGQSMARKSVWPTFIQNAYSPEAKSAAMTIVEPRMPASLLLSPSGGRSAQAQRTLVARAVSASRGRGEQCAHDPSAVVRRALLGG